MNIMLALIRHYISIHALRKESDRIECVARVTQKISIHALRKESDVLHVHRQIVSMLISIHALRKESDPWATRQAQADTNFNPRSP